MKLIDRKQLARKLDVSVWTVSRWLRLGKIPNQVGATGKWSEDEIIAWVQKRANESTRVVESEKS